MQVGSKKARTKRHHHKSLNGCQTCRRKHVKCDELKPACMRRLLTGLDCEYGPPRTWLFPAATQQPHADKLQTLEPSAAFSGSSERRAFFWYTEKVLPNVTGFTAQTGTFWRSLMPRLSDSEPAIRHTLIAIASKHEALGQRAPGTADLTPLCAKHHSLAVQHLVQPQHHIGPEILLMSCVAFSFFERMRNPFAMEARGFDFVQAGLKILRERRTIPGIRIDGHGSTLLGDFLEPMLFQMELVFSMFTRPDLLIYFDSHGLERSPPELPAVFSDMRTARHAFFHIIALRYSVLHEGEEWSMSSDGFRKVRMLLVQCLSAFNAYVSILCPNSTLDQ